MTEKTSLSVLVPVYNEEHLVAASVERLKGLASSPHLSCCEVIVVDDGSTDGTPAALAALERRLQDAPSDFLTWRFIRHETNKGKGCAIRTALEQASGEITVFHDADLEYNPTDLLHIVEVFIHEDADAVFGSRFAGASVRRVLMYRHQIGNRLLTFLCNLCTNLNLTDMETCYKAVRTSLLRSIPLVSNDFRLEPELTIKLAKRQARLFEVPISYSGRTYQEGKKINWRDGFAALWAIVRFSASDNIYKEDKYGSQILARLSRASRFNAWMADLVRPFCGRRILEIGAGVGNLTQHLIPRDRYVASDINPLYLDTLRGLATNRPYLAIGETDVTDAASFPDAQSGFDTVICLNVVEHIEDDRLAIANIASALAPGGRAIVLVPQGQWNYGTLDEVLGHCRRYSTASLTALADHAGLRVEQIVPFNRFGTIAWFLNGRILQRRTFGLVQIKVLQVLMPIIRRVDTWLPLPPLSLIAVLRRDGAAVVPAPAADRDAAEPPTMRVGTPSPPRMTPAARSWIGLLWLFAILYVTFDSFSYSRTWVQVGLPALAPMCDALPAYGEYAGTVARSPDRSLSLAVETGPRQAERQACAQYALAPTVLHMVPGVEPDMLLAHLRTRPVLFDVSRADTPSQSLQAVITQLTSSGQAIVTKQTADGLVLLSAR